MKFKILFILILGVFPFLTFTQVNYPVFRTQKPSVLVRPKSQYLSTLFNLETTFTHFTNPEASSQNDWIHLDWINSFELSPFSIQNLNVGIQTTIGSSGLIVHTVGKWILFPDYKYQPAIGLFADLYTGFSPEKDFLLGSNVQLLVQKNFKTYHFILNDWGVYFAPLLSVHDLDFSIQKINWIAGVIFNNKKTSLLNSEWSLSLEGRYNPSFFEMGLRLLFYI